MTRREKKKARQEEKKDAEKRAQDKTPLVRKFAQTLQLMNKEQE
jgi:hypothetical protein